LPLDRHGRLPSLENERLTIAPTDTIPIVRLGRDGERELVLARWGLVPFWMKEMPKAPHTLHDIRDEFERLADEVGVRAEAEPEQRRSAGAQQTVRGHSAVAVPPDL
jgi:putative SOS response-associated peptidase YedK